MLPVAVLRNLEAVRLGKQGQLRIAALLNNFATFVIPYVANTLEEKQWENVGLEVSGIYRATQDIGGLPEMAFELGEGDA